MTEALTTSAVLPGISPAVFSDGDFRKIARLAYDEAGIVLPDGKSMLVFSRIAPLVRASGAQTFAAFIEEAHTDAAARNQLIGALTTNHTAVYRESHHFEHFAKELRPRLIAALDQGEAVRLWSAGCSSGEETWSMVLTLLGEDRARGVKTAQGDIRVLASDICEDALDRARAAHYSATDLAPLPAALRAVWVQGSGDGGTICPDAHALVRFRHLNLQGEWPITRTFNAIFCRNVMIYFDQPTKERLIGRFADVLEPGGFLYIGHSERVTGAPAELFDLVGPTIYRRRAA
jgi:chemotaxis protein methyltransferase CheR